MDSDGWAFVLGCDVNGLGVIRSLGGKNIPIIALDHNPYAIHFLEFLILAMSYVSTSKVSLGESTRAFNYPGQWEQ